MRLSWFDADARVGIRSKKIVSNAFEVRFMCLNL